MNLFDWSLFDAGKVLTVFLIPFGGGIPAGVLLAQKFSLPWPVTAITYFISDIILACVFEPIMLGFVYIADKYKISWLQKLRWAFRKSTERAMAHYGNKTGPLALIIIAFGVDPMTGRAAAKSAGHGFVTGWLLAIAGDMVFFFVLMASTLWLNNILGDGTLTVLIILALMIFMPPLIRKLKSKFKHQI